MTYDDDGSSERTCSADETCDNNACDTNEMTISAEDAVSREYENDTLGDLHDTHDAVIGDMAKQNETLGSTEVSIAHISDESSEGEVDDHKDDSDFELDSDDIDSESESLIIKKPRRTSRKTMDSTEICDNEVSESELKPKRRKYAQRQKYTCHECSLSFNHRVQSKI